MTKKAKKTDSAGKTSGLHTSFKVMERRKHPRFLLSGEQFRETKTGRIFAAYDLSQNGLSLRIEEKHWPPNSLIQGILNLHPESIEVTARVLGYHGDRVALKVEGLSTYSRSVLAKALGPKRLGASLKLVKEKLPMADYWFHGACSTDVLVRSSEETGDVLKVEVFFSNFYCSWSQHPVPTDSSPVRTGMCQSLGKTEREALLLSESPIHLESIELDLDVKPDLEKIKWAQGILESAGIDGKLKAKLVQKLAHFSTES